MRGTGQRGQALVAVMVAMIILFALAGAVAVGASTLFATGQPNATVANDFQVRSAVNDAVAQIAGLTQACGGPPPPSPYPTPSPTATPGPLQLVLPPGDVATQALCVREDGVVAGGVRTVAATAVLSGCTTSDLGQPRSAELSVLFDARQSGSSGWAYIDTSSTNPSPCTSTFPSGAPPRPGRQRLASGSSVTQVALNGVFSGTNHVYLHLFNVQPSLKQAFVADQDPSGQPSAIGSLYLVAAQTKLTSPDWEEFLFFVRDDRAVNQLLYEAPLP
jgi:hypothetical protein